MIGVLDTQVANTASVLLALERLGRSARLVTNAAEVLRSEALILPGVGSAPALMTRLREMKLVDAIRDRERPTLGICLGMQALFEHSDEGDVHCLGVLSGRVTRLQSDGGLTVPHMGWNQVFRVPEAPPSVLLEGVASGEWFYFVHSYRVPFGNETRASTDYGGKVPALLEAPPWFGTQFHPERSGQAGERVLRNFINASVSRD